MAKIDINKYKNVILFFANKIQNGTLGKLKLMKLLYFLDFDFFEKYGKSVTGDKYLRWEKGPMPATAERILEKMDGRDIKIFREKMPGGYNDKQSIRPLKMFDVALFKREELLMMGDVADKWEKFTGAEMKNASHGEAPWIATKPNEVIDYNLAYYRDKYSEMSKI